MEIWKDIPGYEGLYQVSDMGRVKSVARIKQNGRSYHLAKERILKQNLLSSGYLRIGLHKNAKRKSLSVHRLVLLVFVGESDLTVNHKDGIKTNNTLNNLEYCTQSENIKHAFRLGLTDHGGENNPQSKLSKSDVRKIRALYKTGKYLFTEIGEMFNVTGKHVSKIINRKYWANVQ